MIFVRLAGYSLVKTFLAYRVFRLLTSKRAAAAPAFIEESASEFWSLPATHRFCAKAEATSAEPDSPIMKLKLL